MAAEYAAFEFGLYWIRARKAFEVNLRYTDAHHDLPSRPKPLTIDLDELERHVIDESAYGKALTEMVFRSADVRNFIARAMTTAQTGPVHFRLHLDGPSRFHAVRWESLRLPGTRSPLATSSNILFSRYLTNEHWPPLPSRPPHDARALVVVASPSDISSYHPGGRRLAPLDVKEEVARITGALGHRRSVTLSGPGNATLQKIMQRMNNFEGGFDILYLLCHGALPSDERSVPLLYLEKEDGTAELVDGRLLAECINDLERKPTLAVLVSCQSAGAGDEPRSEDDGVLAALGPRLARAGVGAVVAMQGNITKTTAATFVPAFFEALEQDDAVDRAVAIARGAVRGRPDWWVPVLFSRLRSGRTYHATTPSGTPGHTWQALTTMIKTRHFTPVLGPGLCDGIIGSRREIAQRWARRWQMPIVSHGQGNLTQVAQYLRVDHSPALVSAYLEDYLRTELHERAQDASTGDPFAELDPQLIAGEELEPVILEVGKRLRERDPCDPYRVLASLPVKLFVTTGWTSLLQDALRAEHKEPVTLCFPWKDDIEWANPVAPEPASIGRPWVYHLFGRLDTDNSIVLTEDDYFAWLRSWIDKKAIIPNAVRPAMARNSLMFLGYRLDDWDFRVVFQSIRSFLGANWTESEHVGVQLRPENEIIEPEAAQTYLESYLGRNNVDIFWSTSRNFLCNLRSQFTNSAVS